MKITKKLWSYLESIAGTGKFSEVFFSGILPYLYMSTTICILTQGLWYAGSIFFVGYLLTLIPSIMILAFSYEDDASFFSKLLTTPFTLLAEPFGLIYQGFSNIFKWSNRVGYDRKLKKLLSGEIRNEPEVFRRKREGKLSGYELRDIAIEVVEDEIGHITLEANGDCNNGDCDVTDIHIVKSKIDECGNKANMIIRLRRDTRKGTKDSYSSRLFFIKVSVPGDHSDIALIGSFKSISGDDFSDSQLEDILESSGRIKNSFEDLSYNPLSLELQEELDMIRKQVKKDPKPETTVSTVVEMASE